MGSIAKKYPLYNVKSKYPFTLHNYANQQFSFNAGTIGTFQAREAPTLGIYNPNQPDEIIIDAKFNGQTITFRPKSYVPNGNIKPLLLNEFEILRTIYPSIKKNILSSADGNIEISELNDSEKLKYLMEDTANIISKQDNNNKVLNATLFMVILSVVSIGGLYFIEYNKK